MPVVGERFHPEVHICTVDGSTSEKRVPADLDFAECCNWKGLLPAGTLVESRHCYILFISFIWETERHLTILIFFLACMFLNEATAPMWRQVRKRKEHFTFRCSPSALWRIIAGEIKWRRPCRQWGTVEDAAAAGLMGDNRRTQSQSPGASLYRYNNRNLVWKREPSQTGSQTIHHLGPCEQTRTHNDSNVLKVCEFCHCHLIGVLRGAVLAPAHVRSTQLPNHDKSLLPPVTAQMREEGTRQHTARWPTGLSYRWDDLFGIYLIQVEPENTFLTILCVAAQLRALMLWCCCIHVQHIPSVLAHAEI